MIIKKLIIKNFGDIESLKLEFNDVMNCVTKTVSDAIAYVLNNQFAIRHYNTVELKKDTYIFGQMYHYLKGKKAVYTVEINGFNVPVFKKDNVEMTADEVDGDPVLSRPYREDNACVFSTESKSKFLDYKEFLPVYFSRLTEYSSAFKTVIENRMFFCDEDNLSVLVRNGKPVVHWRASKSHVFKPVERISECDRVRVDYSVFLRLLETIDYHNQSKSKDETIIRTPVIVEGFLTKTYVDVRKTKFALGRTRLVARQTFFVEAMPHWFEQLMK